VAADSPLQDPHEKRAGKDTIFAPKPEQVKIQKLIAFWKLFIVLNAVAICTIVPVSPSVIS